VFKKFTSKLTVALGKFCTKAERLILCRDITTRYLRKRMKSKLLLA